MAYTFKIAQPVDSSAIHFSSLTGTTTMTATYTDHGLSDEDLIINKTVEKYGVYMCRKITYISSSQFSFVGIDGAVAGDDWKRFTYNDLTAYIKTGTLNLSLERNLKNTLSIDMTFDVGDSSIPQKGQKVELWDDSELIFGGYIKRRNLTIQGYQTDNKRNYIKLACVGFESILNRRTVDQEFLSASYDYMDDIAEWVTDNFLVDEGLSSSHTYIDTGAANEEFPADELDKVKTLKGIMDGISALSAYNWYISPDRKLVFKSFASISNCDDAILDTDSDIDNLNLDDDLDDYVNKQFVRGGIDDLGNPLIVGSQDFDEADARQDIEAGTGVYGNVFDNQNIIATTTITCAASCTTTVINTSSAHGLSVGDVVIFIEQDNAKRQVSVINDTDTFTISEALDDAPATNEECITYEEANDIMRSLLYIKKGRNLTFTSNSTFWRPLTKFEVDIEDLDGIDTTGSDDAFMIEKVTIKDVDGRNLKADITASLRDFSNLNCIPLDGWTSFFKKMTDLAERRITTKIGKHKVTISDTEPVNAKTGDVWIDLS